MSMTASSPRRREHLRREAGGGDCQGCGVRRPPVKADPGALEPERQRPEQCPRGGCPAVWALPDLALWLEVEA